MSIGPRNAVEAESRRAAGRPRSGGHPFRALRTIRPEVELVFVGVRPFDYCVSSRAADFPGPQVVADHIFNADQAIDGQRISKELPASVTVLRSVGFTATLGMGDPSADRRRRSGSRS